MSSTLSAVTNITPGLILTPAVNAQIVPALREISAKFDIFEEKYARISALESERNELTQKKLPSLIHRLIGAAVGGIIGITFLIVVTVIVEVLGLGGSALDDMLATILIGPVLFGTPLAGFIILGKPIAKKKIKERDERLAQIDRNLADEKAVFDPIRQELESYNFLPPEFMCGACVDKLIEIIGYNRAETWKEAVNVLSDEVHKAAMEYSQSTLLARSAAAEQAAQAAAGAAAVGAAASVLGALFRS